MEKNYHCNRYKCQDERLIPRVQISKYMRNMSLEYPNAVYVYEFPVKADDTIFSSKIQWDDEIKRYYIEM